MKNARTGAILTVVAIILVVGVGISTMKFAQVNEGQRGMIVTQGRVEAIQEPGIFFRPFAPFTRVEVVNVRRQTREITQNVASSDKQLYDISIQVDYSRRSDEAGLRGQFSEIGVNDDQLTRFLDGFINDALKSASTQFTLDEALSDRNGFSTRITQFLRAAPEGGRSPIDQIYINLEAVKVLDISVGEQYARLLSEKANLEVQIETEQKRREQIEAQQSNNLFQAEQEAQVALTRERGITSASLEASNRDAQIRAIEGRYWRENPELFELRKRELLVQMMSSGNLWFIDPETNLTLLLNQMAEGQTTAAPIVIPPTAVPPVEQPPVTP